MKPIPSDSLPRPSVSQASDTAGAPQVEFNPAGSCHSGHGTAKPQTDHVCGFPPVARIPERVSSRSRQELPQGATAHSPTTGRHARWTASPWLRRSRRPILSAGDMDWLAHRVAQVLVGMGFADRLLGEQQRTGQDPQADHLVERVAQRVVELQEKQVDRLARRLADHLRARPATPPSTHDSDKAAAELLRRLDEP
jgi:hypothetical protein